MYDESVSILTSALRREQLPVGEWRQHEGKPSKEVLALPFYRFVPKEPVDQLRWRLYVRQRTAHDLEFREAIRYACEHDILFAFNSLLWIFEPRPIGRKLPFNTWADQDDYIVWTYNCFGKRDVGVEKCRGIGWSYLAVGIFYLDWLFKAFSTLGMMSRKEDAVDEPDNPDALFYKLDFMHTNMPEWLRVDPRIDADDKKVLSRSKCKFAHKLNGSTIFGYESTGNVLTGGRKRAVLEDEAAKFPMASAQEAANSVQHTTNCRVKVSTYFRGTSTVFYSTMRREESTMLKVRAHWHQNPERSKGLYTFEKGQLKILDASYEFPPDYKFIDVENDREAKGQKIRSPWYDYECGRPGATKIGIAEELDVDPKTASTKLIDLEAIERAQKTARTPLHRGRIDFADPNERLDTLKDFDPLWVSTGDGRVRLWKPLNAEGRLGYGGPYSLGCDLSSGRGGSHTSNSSLCVIDDNTGEQILEFYANDIEPGSFAQHVIAIMLWLSDGRGQGWCRLTFENNGGPGEDFADEIERLSWANVAYHERRTKGGRSAKKMGWRNSFGPYTILLPLQRAILRNQCIVRSEMVAAELDQYEMIDNKVVHSGSHYDPDGAAKGLFHGDVAVGLALAWQLAQEKIQVVAKTKEREIPYGSLAQRIMDQAARSSGADDDWWLREYDDAPALDAQNPLLKLIAGVQESSGHEPQEFYSSREAV